MNSIKFPESNVAIAEDQPEYETLHAHVSHSESGTTTITACFKLTEEEMKEVAATGEIWYQQLKHPHAAMQPMMLLTSKPQING